MRDVDYSKLEIVMGASNLKDQNPEKGVIKRRISGYQLHDKNEDGGADYDIAIVEVVEEIPFEVSTVYVAKH